MESFDILFPANIPPLTYYVSEELRGIIKPGQLVKADLRNKERVGLVFKRSSTKGLKPIKGICFTESIISDPLLRLIEWMSDYYMVNEGLVLKTMYTEEFFESAQKININLEVFKDREAEKGKYRTSLYYLFQRAAEFSLLIDLVRRRKHILILCPERSYVERVAEKLRPLLDNRFCLLHGDLTKKERVGSYSRIISGQSDIVIGTRIAVFAPLRKVSVLVVLSEEDGSYKNIQGMRFHARDVAVMRGYLERAEVYLTSLAPSAESYYNAIKGKYRLIRYGAKPKIRREIIDMNKTPKVSPYISKRIIDVAKDCLRSKGNLLFLVNRKGYSLIRCRDCDYIEGCDTCKVPLVYHRDKNQLLCHYCGKAFKLRDVCPVCGGATFEAVGAGIQRIEAEIKRHLSREPLRLEKGINIEEIKTRFEGLREGELIVSTGIIKQLYPEGFFNVGIFINPDIHLQSPDFRSGERLFKELQDMGNWVKQGGLLLVQTRFPENHIYRAFRKGSINEFYSSELPLRRSLLYPPFSSFAAVTITCNSEYAEAMEGLLNSLAIKELIHSYQFSTTSKKKSSWRLIFKSSSKKRLREKIWEMLSAMEDKKGAKVIIDIDPVSLLKG